MKCNVVMTLPRYDEVTEYLSIFSKEIEDEASMKGISLKLLKDKDVCKQEFEKVIKKLDCKMVIFNGHGSDKEIYGHNNEILVSEDENHQILFDRLVYARSCDAGVSLGKVCVKNSLNGCFIGYSTPFVFYVNEKWSPQKDNAAKLFLEPSNLVPISIIKGNTAIEAHEKSKKSLLKNMKKVLRDKTKDAFLIAGALWNNYSGQVLLGNGNALF